jgi:putative nucleotidyltransferase with HDIG domain
MHIKELTMRIPPVSQAEGFLREAGILNPGPWIEHSQHTANAAKHIAEHHPKLDADVAYILGLLHDIGRREGRSHLRHVVDGYHFLEEMGYADAAQICLTHSFPIKEIDSYFGDKDISLRQLAFISERLHSTDYGPYDRLIQLCDALALPSGFCLLEKRMVDVALRYGTNRHTAAKWKQVVSIKDEFSRELGQSIYAILPGVVENTFL